MRTQQRLARVGVIAAAMLALATAPADAQFGGLKNRVKEKVAEKTAEKVVDKALGGKEQGADAAPAPAGGSGARSDNAGAAASAEPARRGPYGEYVLEMTPEVLDRFAAALAAEVAERQAIPTRKREYEAATQKYSTCYYAALQSPEMEKVNAKLAQAGEKNDVELLMKASQEQLDLTRTKCGEHPEEPDYGRLALDKAREKGGFKDRQYDIIKERIAPFCGAGSALIQDGDGVRVGSGRIAYVYSATEVAQLKSRCGQLTAAMSSVL